MHIYKHMCKQVICLKTAAHTMVARMRDPLSLKERTKSSDKQQEQDAKGTTTILVVVMMVMILSMAVGVVREWAQVQRVLLSPLPRARCRSP